SSRRRHTRSDRDWSSDVYSSDLKGGAKIAATAGQELTMVELTREGIEALRGELDTLVSQRSGVREEIRKAMLDKDFRENAPLDEIGRASCRERVERWVGDGVRKK